MDFRLVGEAFEQAVEMIHLRMLVEYWWVIATWTSVDWSAWNPTEKCVIVGSKNGVISIDVEKV